MAPSNPPQIPIRHSFQVVIRPRPDLDRFKPANGEIFSLDPLLLASLSSENTRDRPKSSHKSAPLRQVLSDTRARHVNTDSPDRRSLKVGSSSNRASRADVSPARSAKKSKLARSKPGPSSNKASQQRLKSSAKANRPKSRKRIHSSSSSDNPDDVDDLFLSDFEEPETKLREREPEVHHKFAKLRRARKQTNKMRELKKEVHSRRIVPDSDGENEVDVDEDSEDTESSESEETESSTDEDERRQREKEFIVDDMATQADKNRVEKRLARAMPTQYRNIKQDNISHFKVVCQFLVFRILIPHKDWRSQRPQFDHSCRHLESHFQTRTLQLLESAAWTSRFRNDLRSRPFIKEGVLLKHKLGCSACNNRTKHSSKSIKLHGPKYHPITLRSSEAKPIDVSSSSDSEDNIDSFSDASTIGGKPKVSLDSHITLTADGVEYVCGQDCAKRALDYHYFRHWLLNTLQHLKREVVKLRDGKPTLSFSDPKPSEEEEIQLRKEARRMIDKLEEGDLISPLFQRLINGVSRIEKTYTVG